MEKKHPNPSSEPVTKADLTTLKSEIIEAVKDTVKGFAMQETVNTVMETVVETKEHVTDLTGLMNDMLQELTATHEDVRYVRTSVTPGRTVARAIIILERDSRMIGIKC